MFRRSVDELYEARIAKLYEAARTTALNDELYEARIADLKESHEARVRELMRLVDALAEQVEYLRAQLGRPFIASGHPGVNPSQQPLVVPNGPGLLHVSEEEEDLLAMREMGHIDNDFALQDLRQQMGLPRLSVDQQ